MDILNKIVDDLNATTESVKNIIALIDKRWNSDDPDDFRDMCIYAWKELGNEQLYREFIKRSYPIAYGTEIMSIVYTPYWHSIEDAEVRNVKAYFEKHQ